MDNEKWLADQFSADKTSPETARKIISLLKTWDGLSVEDGQEDEILGRFVKLAKKQMIADPEPDAKWLAGSIQTPGVGQTVRVPPDKFTGHRGQSLNGRVGKVVAVRYGDVIFNTTDDLEYIEGIRLRPHELEIKIN